MIALTLLLVGLLQLGIGVPMVWFPWRAYRFAKRSRLADGKVEPAPHLRAPLSMVRYRDGYGREHVAIINADRELAPGQTVALRYSPDMPGWTSLDRKRPHPGILLIFAVCGLPLVAIGVLCFLLLLLVLTGVIETEATNRRGSRETAATQFDRKAIRSRAVFGMTHNKNHLDAQAGDGFGLAAIVAGSARTRKS